MILVTGATGQFGGKAIDHLLQKGVDASEIFALVRDTLKGESLKEKGIELRVGDYRDQDSLIDAFQNIDQLLLVSSNDSESRENRTSQHINAIKAAKEAHIKYIVYTSFVRRPKFEDSAIADFQDVHVQSEQFLKDSGIDYTILQNGIYMEMIPLFAGEKVDETGAVMFPAEDGKASYTLREEMAEAAANVLTTGGHRNKTYPLTNSQSVSFGEIAEALSDTLGKEVDYQSPSAEVFRSKLKKAGVPDAKIDMLILWATAQSQGAMDLEDDTLKSFLGRKPTTVKQFIEQVYG